MPTPKGYAERGKGAAATSNSLFAYVEKSITKNMGEYNSAKVTIGITLPFNPTQEQLDDARNTVKKAVEVVDPLIVDEVVQLFDEDELMEDSPLRNAIPSTKKPVKRGRR